MRNTDAPLLERTAAFLVHNKRHFVLSLSIFAVIMFSKDYHVGIRTYYQSRSTSCIEWALREDFRKSIQNATNTKVEPDLPFNSTKDLRVGLVDYCVGDSYARISQLVQYNRQAYAQRWGYKIYSGGPEEVPVQTFITPRAWLKAVYLHQLLSTVEEIEWFVWLDCDALITDLSTNISKVLNDLNVQPHHDMVVARDAPGDEGPDAFNTGVIFVRNSKWSRDLWKHALQSASNESIRRHDWWEQYALMELHKANQYNESRHVLVTPDRWKINAFENFEYHEYNASFVVHRVNCHKQPECDLLSETWFCATMPHGSYPKELLDCSDDMYSKLCIRN